MFVTFRNNSSDTSIRLNVSGSEYIIDGQSCVKVAVDDASVVFYAEMLPTDLSNAFDGEETPKKLKDRIFFKLAKKFAEKIPELGLYSSCEYKLTEITDGMTVELYDGGYSILDGTLSQWLFEMVPIIFTFARAEVLSGKLKFVRAKLVNRKKYLKIIRNLLIFLDLELFLPNLIFFIPKYIIESFLATGLCLTLIMKRLYSMPVTNRVHKINSNLKDSGISSKRSFFSVAIKCIIAVAVIYAIGYFLVSSDPEVIVSTNLKTVECYDEVFVQIPEGLPDDAEKVLFQNYYAYYQINDDEYVSDKYYCYIYEDAEGERYMWLKDGCDLSENENREYEDYDKPLVYKSIGERPD